MTGPTVFNTDTTHPSCGRPMHAGMTAREHLEVHAHWGFASGEQMRAAIDAHANELADRIVAASMTECTDLDCEQTMCGGAAMRHAASLIRPEPPVPDGTIRVLNANGDVCIEQPPKEQP